MRDIDLPAAAPGRTGTAGGFSMPARTDDQRLAALKVANNIRTRRAALKRDIAARRVDPTAIAADPPAWARTMRVAELLLAVPALGPVKTSRLLRTNGVSPSKTLAGLSDRQRAAIVAELERRQGGAR